MPWGNRSKQRLLGAHYELQLVADRTLELAEAVNFDLTVGEVRRTREKHQKKLDHNPPRTTVAYEDSLHSHEPSDAVHLLPHPIRWPQPGTPSFAKDTARFYVVATLVMLAAHQLREEGKIHCRVRGGHDWDGDGDWNDQTFDDLAHFERRPL